MVSSWGGTRAEPASCPSPKAWAVAFPCSRSRPFAGALRNIQKVVIRRRRPTDRHVVVEKFLCHRQSFHSPGVGPLCSWLPVQILTIPWTIGNMLQQPVSGSAELHCRTRTLTQVFRVRPHHPHIGPTQHVTSLRELGCPEATSLGSGIVEIDEDAAEQDRMLSA